VKKLSAKDIIDVIGLVAILLGLFFVYKEIELNATVARAQLSAETNQNLFALDQMLIEGDLSHAFRLAYEDPEELSPDERMRLNIFLANVLEQYARECYYEDLGIFSECESVPRSTALRYFGSRYGRAFWKTVRGRMIGPRISAIVDDELAANPADDIAMQIDQGVLENLSGQ